jgi:hypothetical protein
MQDNILKRTRQRQGKNAERKRQTYSHNTNARAAA